MPQGGFWSFRCCSEASSLYCQSWTLGWASHHDSLSPETTREDHKIDQNCHTSERRCKRSRTASSSIQSHRDTTVMGLLGWIRRSFRGKTLLLSSLRAARRCSFLLTAGSSPWRYKHNTNKVITRCSTDPTTSWWFKQEEVELVLQFLFKAHWLFWRAQLVIVVWRYKCSFFKISCDFCSVFGTIGKSLPCNLTIHSVQTCIHSSCSFSVSMWSHVG